MTYLSFSDSTYCEGRVVGTSTGQGNGNGLIDKTVKDVVIPSTNENKNVVEIGWDAFKFTNIESVFIPKTIMKISGYSFSGCSFLKKVIFEPGSNLKEFGSSVFCAAKSLKKIDFPPSLSSIGSYPLYSFFSPNPLKCFSYLGTQNFASVANFFNSTPKIIHVSKYYPSSTFAGEPVVKDDISCNMKVIRCTACKESHKTLYLMCMLIVMQS